MQPVHANLAAVLENATASDPRDLVWLFELYEPSVLPTSDGFDNADASECFAGIEITWLGQAYRRAVLDAGSITKAKGARSNRCTLRLSNADENRYVATWVTQNQVEGMRLVVRLISRSASVSLATSTIRFSGRCEKPDGFDTIQGSISAVEDVGGIDVEFPPRLYLPDDPEGRSPADPLYEGFPYILLNGTFTYLRSEPDKNFSRKDSRRYVGTLPYSSFDDTPLGEAITMILGRSQIQMNRGIYVDEGRITKCGDFACMGPIAGFLNFRMLMDPDYAKYFAQPQSITYHLGEAGGTGTQTADPLWPTHPLFSYTAWISYILEYIGTGAFTNIDAGQATVATVLGLICDLPDASGVYNQTGWSDNGADHVRLLLTGERFFNLDPAFIEDAAGFITRQYNNEPLVDESNSGLIYIPSPDLAAAGVDFQRFLATGYVDKRRARYTLGLEPTRPEETPTDEFPDFDPFDPPTIPVEATRLIKRFTTNVLLKKRVKGTDFLYNTVLPSFRGYLVWNYRGKIEIRSERPADFAHLRSTASAGASTLAVEDVTPWTASGGLWGKILLGTPLTTSEVRKVTSAAYTADANGITLTAGKTGAVTVSASGATLAGGNSSTKATGTVTIGGTPGAGDTVTVTINGIPVTYTVESDETTATVAYMVAAHINANTQLRRFVSAVAAGAVVTISSKWGVLTLTAPVLANSHTGPVANVTTAPAGLSASGSGSSLLAGSYRVAYANRNANGSTYLTPYSSVSVTAGQQINIPALAFPAGVTSRDWFVSKGAGDPEMVLHTNNTTALGFAITAVPSSTAAPPPEYNTTGEELVRVAMSFASNNQTAAILAQANLTRGNIFDGTYKWPGGRDQATYTEVVGNYVSAKDDFAPSKAIVKDKALRLRLGKDAPRELDLTAVDNFHQARRLVYFDFAKFIDRHWFNTLGSNGLAFLLEEGDVICASDDSGGHVNVLTQIEEFTINLPKGPNDYATVSIGKARLYGTEMFRELVPKTRPVLPSVLRWTATLNSEVQLLDLPFWRTSDAEKGPGIMVAIRRATGTGDWGGSFLWLNTGDGYKQIAMWDVEATTGEALDALADHAAGSDATSTVTVRLDNPLDSIATVTDDELRAGANLFRLGGEIFQAKTCALVGGTDDEYVLSNLVRGLHGTEGDTAGHAIGDEFTVLDGKVFHLAIDAKHAGSEISVVAQTVNQDFADATPHTLDWEANSVRPLAIARVETDPDTLLAPRDSEGSILVAPWPRTNAEKTGDEYLAEYLSDDRLTVMHSEAFGEDAETPALFKSHAVLLSGEGSDKYINVTGNTVSGTGDDATTGPSGFARARSLQRILKTGNYVEGTLKVNNAATDQAMLGLISEGMDWKQLPTGTAYTPVDYVSILSSAAPGQYELTLAVDGALALTLTESDGITDEERVRVEVVGAVAKFYRHTAQGLALLYESSRPPTFPLRAWASITFLQSGFTTSVERVMMTTRPLPTTILTAEQQTLYYGSLKSPVQVRITQHSGVREVGYGFPYETAL